ncbi:MAG TPA: TolC family protein [Bryobacteraceae bacterium]|jgi:cobalt-zinc-cadmium efflux system outer membrane protein|nr:TolC family protein [Bryobacteraceae bacterium]
MIRHLAVFVIGFLAQPLSAAMAVPDLLKDARARPPVALNQFEQFALAANPTLEQANAIVKQSAGRARQAGLIPNPSVGYQGEQIRGGAYGGGEQGAFIQQDFVLGGKLGLRRNVYEQQRLSDEIGVTEQRYRVTGDVDRTFYAALAAQAIVDVRHRLLGLAMDTVETAHQLANVGQADAPDVLQAEVESEQAQIDYVSAQRSYIQQFRALAALVGKPDLPLAPLAGDLEKLPSINTDEIADRIANESPEVKRAQQDVVRAEAELKSAKRESVPDLEIRAGLEQNYERLADANPTRVGLQGFASAGITLPIFNRNQGSVAAASADLERAKGEITRVKLSLRRSIQPLLETYLSERLEEERYKTEMIPLATRAYQLYLAKYRHMAAAYPEVIVSQRTVFQLQVSYVNVLGDLWSNAIVLQNYLLTDGLTPPQPAGPSAASR